MNHAHLRLVKPANSTQASSLRTASSISERGPYTEEDVDALTSDPTEVLARELSRTVKRCGPLPQERAVYMVQNIAHAIAAAHAAGRYVDTGSHVFWLGAILFYALTGQAPLAPQPGSTGPQTASPSLASLAPHPVDPAIAALVEKCMSPRRADRFASAAEVCDAFAALGMEEPEEHLGDELDADERPSHTRLLSIPPISSYTGRDWEEAALDHAI